MCLSFDRVVLAMLCVFLLLAAVACAAPAPTLTPTASPQATSVPVATSPPTTAPTPSPISTASPTPTRLPPTSVPPTPTPLSPVLSPTNLASLKPAAQASVGFVSSFGWASDSRTLTALLEGAVVSLDAVRLSQTSAISTTFAAQVLALAPDGTRIVGLAADKSVQIWNAQNGTPELVLSNAGQVAGATFTPDSRYVATWRADEMQVQLWDATTGNLIRTLKGFQTAAPVYSAVFAPDRQTMAWIARGTVQFIKIETGEPGAKLEFEDSVSAAQFTLDGQSLVTIHAATQNNQPVGVLEVWDATKGERKQQLTGPQLMTGLAISPDGNLVASAVGRVIIVWNWSAGVAPTLVTASGAVSALSFAPDGSALVTGDQNGTIVVWRVP